MKSVCSTQKRPILKAYCSKDNTIYLYQPRCKMWRCPYCAQVNKHQWCIRISEGIKTYQTKGIDGWSFITVTSHSSLSSQKSTMYVWPNAWAKLSRRMRYHFPGIRYVLLPELHVDGRMHIHAIASHSMDTRWLKNTAPYCGLGYMNTSEPIQDHMRSIYYVTKYLNKSIMDVNWPSKFRRVRTSQKWPETPTGDDFTPLELDWVFYLSYFAEGLDYIAHELSAEAGKRVKILT